jgi:monovalent cation/proton antiporter MnhG/PhaG subunit
VTTALQIVGLGLLATGLLLATIGLYGMLRHPGIFDQIHAAGLITGPAIILILAASIATREAEIITSAALVILFVLVTSPLSGHATAQAASLRARRREGRPGPGHGDDGSSAESSTAGS